MAVLETIRVKFGVLITILIAVALLSFLVDPNSLASAFQSNQQELSVGVINGKTISYQEYHARVELETTMLSGRLNNLPEAQRNAEIHGSAWNYFMVKYLFIPKAEELGITVSQSEVQNYLKMVLPADQAMFFAENMDTDRMIKANWEYIVENVTNQLYQQKLFDAYSAGAASDSVKVDFAANLAATFSTADYVKVPYDMTQEVEVSQEEVEAYYNAHQNLFQQEAYRDIVYVALKVENDANDKELKASEQARKVAQQIISDSEGTVEGFKNAAIAAGQVVDETSVYAGQTVINNIEGITDSSKKIARWAFENAEGSVSEVFAIDNNTFVVAAVTGIHVKGTATIAESQKVIEATLKSIKIKDAALAQANAAIEGCTELAQVAKNLNTEILSQENVSFDSSLDPVLVGAIAGAQTGVITKALAGVDGVYVVCVKDRQQKNLEGQKNSYVSKEYMNARSASMLYGSTLVKENTEYDVEKYF